MKVFVFVNKTNASQNGINNTEFRVRSVTPNTFKLKLANTNGIPTAELSGTNNEVQYTNSGGIIYTGFKYMSIKVVLTATSQGLVPRVKDLMAIALQV